MATRFYFPASTAAAVSPAYDASWFSTASAVRRNMTATKGSSAIAVGSTISLPDATSPSLDRQYVSDPLAAQSIAGAAVAKMQLMVREFDLADNVDYIIISLRLVSNDGTTVRSTLLNWAGYGTVGTEFINNATCRNSIGCVNTWDFGTNGSIPGGPYPVLDGDRLVLEIGYGCSGGVGTTPQAAAKYGENATDLPEDDTQTTDGAGWFEISQTLTFSGTVHQTTVAFSETVTASFSAGAIRGCTVTHSVSVSFSASAKVISPQRVIRSVSVAAFTPGSVTARGGPKSKANVHSYSAGEVSSS